MNEISAVEIAKRQRHYSLLKKVKENKHLTAAEITELETYEEMARKPIKQNTEVRRQKTVKKRKGKKSRTLLSLADCQRLGFDYPDIAEADKNSGIDTNLFKYLAKHQKLRAAYDRGKLLKKLVELAPVATVSDAAMQLKNLGFTQFKTGQDLRDFLDKDAEAEELWKTADVNATIQNREALRKTANDGNTKAIQMMDTWFKDRKGGEIAGGANFNRVTTNQMSELFGVSRQTVYEWNTQKGLTQNIDGSYDLHTALSWFEDFIIKKVTKGKSDTISSLNPYQAVKTEREKLRLEQDKGAMIPRETIIGTMIAQYQNIINAFNSLTDLANRVFGQPREEIVNRLEEFRDDITAKLQHVPAELKMSEPALEKLAELYELIRPQNTATEGTENVDCNTTN